MNELDIYFEDFNEETQQAILEMAGISDPSEANWDVLPIATIYFDENKEE